MFEMRTQPTGDAAPKTFGEIKVVVLGVKYCYVPGLEYGVAHQGRGSKVTDAAVVAAANRVEMEEPTTRAEHAKKELNQLGSQHEQLREQQCQLEYILANMGIHRSNGAIKGRKRVAYGGVAWYDLFCWQMDLLMGCSWRQSLKSTLMCGELFFF